MNTGTARIVIIAALLGIGSIVLFRGFDSGGTAVAVPQGGAASPSPTPTPTGSTSPEPVVETPSPAAPKNTVIAVFNGTNEVGLGSGVQQTLTGDGYGVGQDAKDSPTKPISKTIVYFVGGKDAAQNESNAQALADKYFKRARVLQLKSDFAAIVEKDVQVVVVVGVDHSTQG